MEQWVRVHCSDCFLYINVFPSDISYKTITIESNFLPWQYEYVHRFCVKDCPHARYCRTWQWHEGNKVFTPTLFFQPWSRARDIVRSQSMLYTLAWTQSEGCAFPTTSTVFESHLLNSSVVDLRAVRFISVRRFLIWDVTFIVPWGILHLLFRVTASAPNWPGFSSVLCHIRKKNPNAHLVNGYLSEEGTNLIEAYSWSHQRHWGCWYCEGKADWTGAHHWTHFTPVWKEVLVHMSISDGLFGHCHTGPCFAVALSHYYRWELTVLYVSNTYCLLCAT